MQYFLRSKESGNHRGSSSVLQNGGGHNNQNGGHSHQNGGHSSQNGGHTNKVGGNNGFMPPNQHHQNGQGIKGFKFFFRYLQK